MKIHFYIRKLQHVKANAQYIYFYIYFSQLALTLKMYCECAMSIYCLDVYLIRAYQLQFMLDCSWKLLLLLIAFEHKQSKKRKQTNTQKTRAIKCNWLVPHKIFATKIGIFLFSLIYHVKAAAVIYIIETFLYIFFIPYAHTPNWESKSKAQDNEKILNFLCILFSCALRALNKKCSRFFNCNSELHKVLFWIKIIVCYKK